MTNNELFRTISIALNLRDTDQVRLMDLGGAPISKAAAQDMQRKYNPDKPLKSRRVYEDHLLAFLEAIEAEAEYGGLPIQPQNSLLAVIRGIRIAIGAGERWPIFGPALEERMEKEMRKHRGDRP